MRNDWQLSGVCVAASQSETVLLKDVRATFAAGTITLLVGHNGAGKSTLLETMAGLRPPAAGELRLGGEPLWIGKRRRRRLNRNVIMRLGIAMQHSDAQWFEATARRELLYSMKPYGVAKEGADERIVRSCETAGFDAELLGRDPWTLSGGQQRRLSLACLLACEPEWLLLDEPTAGLDAEGIRRLAAALAAHRAAGRGAVVATHDLDALLPLADAVVAVEGGAVREAASAAVWAAARPAAAPQALRALAQLRAAGALPPPAGAGGGEPLWPSPRELAAALAGRLMRRQALGGEAAVAAAAHAAATAPGASAPQAGIAAAAAAKAEPPLLAARFDPRALIAAYLLLSSAVLAGDGWIATLAAAIATGAVLLPLRATIRPWAGAIRAYVVLLAVMSAITGIGLSPLAFDAGRALQTVQRLLELLLVMLLGMPFLALVTPLRMQRAIEQTFGFLNRLRVPVTPIALTVTLLFRFIPLLTREWGRFALIAHARGKATTAPGSLPAKHMASALIPYIRSMLRMAEQLADAMEARGIGHPESKPTRGFVLAFAKADVLLLAGALLLSAALIAAASLD